MQSEKSLRDLIARNIRKEIHPGTKPSVEFIKKILDDAYESGMRYDVSDLRPVITTFASRSTNHALPMMRLVRQMHFTSDILPEKSVQQEMEPTIKDERYIFFDIEVFKNLLLVCWKFEDDDEIVSMINPTPNDIEELLEHRLIGFNNRRYDNHILYGRYMGDTQEGTYRRSKGIIEKDKGSYLSQAYGISYADIYDFTSKKQSLKKYEIELGLKHLENDLPWDEDVPDEKLDQVIEYCKNDVVATEAVFKNRAADFKARKILSDLSGLPVNDSTQNHTAKILFEGDRDHKDEFKYTNLSETFPGYKHDFGKSTYRGEDVGEGGYVYAEPGMYHNVAVLDVASMHPTSIMELDLFGKYTKNFGDLLNARIAIKHEDYEAAREMLDGKLAPYLEDSSDAKELSYALKIVINIVYGLTSAKWDNKFTDRRNKDNIVAKRGALFMVDLKHFVQERGFQVIHIKTDSIKIPNATDEIIQEVMDFGKKYGYTFEHENTYNSICLVNNAVYIARDGQHWDAVGAQFQHPYVFKKLFTHEDITFRDFCETREVKKGDIYLSYEVEPESPVFIGKIGTFVPVLPGTEGAGKLLRIDGDKKAAVTGTKDWLWGKADVIGGKFGPDVIDTSYAEQLVSEAVADIESHGEFQDLFPRSGNMEK